jgi:hypothetical protein
MQKKKSNKITINEDENLKITTFMLVSKKNYI